MIPPERIADILKDIEANIRMLDVITDLSIAQDDLRHLEEGIKAASREVVSIDPERVEEAWDLQPLHDRVHFLTVTLRIFRNNLERAETQVNEALEKTRDLINKVETPDTLEDDSLWLLQREARKWLKGAPGFVSFSQMSPPLCIPFNQWLTYQSQLPPGKSTFLSLA